MAMTAALMEGALIPYGPNRSPPSWDLPANADGAATASRRRHVLPKDLPTAIKQLDDQELDRLLVEVLAEQQWRGRKPPASDEVARKRTVDSVAISLAPGKLNAVRAAFKAGVKPTQIARQFGISRVDVRKALGTVRSRA